MKLLAFLFSAAAVLQAAHATCDDFLQVQITPTIHENKIQNVTIDLVVYTPIDVGRGGPHSGGRPAYCQKACTNAGIGTALKATKVLTDRCGDGKFVDNQFDSLKMNLVGRQWYVSDFEIPKNGATNGTAGRYGTTSMSIMVLNQLNIGKTL
jgi:hypothetical protein